MSDGARHWVRPTLWPTVVTAAFLVILILLGNWQVRRLAWKRGLLHEIAEHMAAPPAPFPDVIKNPQEWAYRRVTATGVFDYAHEMYLFGSSREAGGAGYQVIVPLMRAGKPAVLVNRGWVPTRFKNPATRAAGQIAGDVTVTGLVRFSGRANIFSPANQPAQNTWYVRDIPSMVKHLGFATAPQMIDADNTPNPGGWPVGGQTIIDIPNNHLDYALTWYGLALVLLVIYVVYHWRRR